ncbi:MAG: hypothetical protein WDN47_02705 [Candidatus Doudnabacteria bacterium]
MKPHSIIWVDGYGTKIVRRFPGRERAEVVAIDDEGINVRFIDLDAAPQLNVPFEMAHNEPSPHTAHVHLEITP